MGDHPVFEGDLMSVDVTAADDSVSADRMPSGPLPSLPGFVTDLRDVKDEEISGRFTVEVTPTDTMGREDYSGPSYYRFV